VNIQEEVVKAQKRIDSMVKYLLMKVDAGDWHAVADAAMDIREFEARKKALEEVKDGKEG
jgi:hypothetical protein